MRRLEAKLDNKVDALNAKIDAQVGSLKDMMAAMHLELKEGFAAIPASKSQERMWWLLIAAGILGLLARGMKWI